MNDTERDRLRRGRFWRLLYFTVSHSFPRRFSYSFEPIESGTPFLLICNHVTNNDPFFVGLAYKKVPLAFVASEHIFRQGLLSKLLTRYLAPIARPKADSGVGTVRAVLKRLREGDPVVLFAEGDCTWNGVSGKIFPATGKLAKAAGVPLVTYRLEGGYLTFPRWAKKRRRGKMHGRLVHVYTKEELKSMTADAVEDAINRDIYYDTWEEQRNNPVQFRSKAPAEGLERALFICPECGDADCMASDGSSLYCTTCGAGWIVDGYGFLKGPSFSTVYEWDEWQKKAVACMKGSGLFRFTGTLTNLDENASEKAEVSLDADGRALVLNGRPIPLLEINDMAMVKTNRLLFVRGDGYYEIKTKRGILRPYLLAWRAFREETEGR